MHEFALYSQVPSSRHNQVLALLAGVTASQPARSCELVLIFQPMQPPNAALKKGAIPKPVVQTQRLYSQVTRQLYQPRIGLTDSNAWTLKVEELPQPGIQNMISRGYAEKVLAESDLDLYRGGSTQQKYVNQYLLDGHRCIHGNVVISMTKILMVPEGTGALEPLDAPLPVLDECKMLDPSGSYLLEACVRAEDGNNSKLMEQARDELLAFRKHMEGAIDLRVPDRLALDTRVKSN